MNEQVAAAEAAKQAKEKAEVCLPSACGLGSELGQQCTYDARCIDLLFL